MNNLNSCLSVPKPFDTNRVVPDKLYFEFGYFFPSSNFFKPPISGNLIWPLSEWPASTKSAFLVSLVTVSGSCINDRHLANILLFNR